MKLIFPVLISIVAFTSCSQALYKNKYDWVKVDRQPAVPDARPEPRTVIQLHPEQHATVAIDSFVYADSSLNEQNGNNGGDENQPCIQEEVKPAHNKSLIAESQTALTFSEVTRSDNSRLDKSTQQSQASGDKSVWRAIWSAIKIIFILTLCGSLTWLYGGWPAVGVMLIFFLIMMLLFNKAIKLSGNFLKSSRR